MIGELILFGIIALPLLLGILFKVGTSHIFFALMAGELLGRYFGHDLEKQAATVNVQNTPHGLGEVVLIVAPMLLTAILLRGTLPKGRIFLHLLPFIITGVVFAAFVLPLLPEVVQSYVADEPTGKFLLDMNKWIVGGMIILQLLHLWFTHRKKAAEHH